MPGRQKERDKQRKQMGDNRKEKTHGDTKEAGGEVMTITASHLVITVCCSLRPHFG